MIIFLTAGEILRLHYQIIEDYGGTHGVRDENRLKSVIEAPKQQAFGHEQYPLVYDKAAVYLRNIIGDHPFSDGNKRTAVTVCAIFLARNDLRIQSTPKELEDFAVRVATEHVSVGEVAAWLEAYCLMIQT